MGVPAWGRPFRIERKGKHMAQRRAYQDREEPGRAGGSALHRWLCLLLGTGLMLLTACAQPRLSASSCMPRLYPLRLDPASGIEVAPPPGVAGPPQTYGEAIEAAALARPRTESDTGPAQHLVLSGGGKWGSFGAGFLLAMPDRANYSVVTGVSTGALQASFAFLGDQLVPASRAAIYTAANDLALAPSDRQPGQGRRFIDDLPRAYTVTRSESVIVVKGGLITALRRGAAGDFAPLRARLALLLDRDTMQRIADAGSRDGRRLFVGVIDVDDGQAYAVDLIDLASKAVDGQHNFATVQKCYIDALIASSSEPLEVKPVFMAVAAGLPRSPRMYIDGGVRTGVFLQEVLDKRRVAGSAGPGPRIDTTIIVNGNLRVDDQTGATDANWNLLQLALRTKELLVDQVYEYSVDRVLRSGSARGAVRLTTARGYEGDKFMGRTCAQWQQDEKAVAFPPNFMRCLIGYGEHKAVSTAPWEVLKPPPGT